MKKIRRKLLVAFLLLCFLVVPSKSVFASDQNIYLGGMPIGFSIMQRGAEVVGLTDVLTENGTCSPAKDAGIKAGDLILSINGVEVNDAKDLTKTLTNCDSKEIVIDRKGEEIVLTVEPKKDIVGNYKLGLFIRDEINGIGTVTYIKGNQFASLGHPIINDRGEILNIKRGEIYNSLINGLKKGERGCAGELHGVFLSKGAIGCITSNTNKGVYGSFYGKIDNSNLTKIKTAEGKIGEASIYSTIEGKTPKEYKISIIKADYSETLTKNFVIKIEDQELLNKTGGIVQGMSGSPIVQNGKLIGAVTHVFINDPTRGFGISIQNMEIDFEEKANP